MMIPAFCVVGQEQMLQRPVVQGSGGCYCEKKKKQRSCHHHGAKSRHLTSASSVLHFVFLVLLGIMMIGLIMHAPIIVAPCDAFSLSSLSSSLSSCTPTRPVGFVPTPPPLHVLRRSRQQRACHGSSSSGRPSPSSLSLSLSASNGMDQQQQPQVQDEPYSSSVLILRQEEEEEPEQATQTRLFPSLAWRRRIPNWLTYLRCLAIPLVGVLFCSHYTVAACGLFATASITDWLDGYLARKWSVTTSFGAFLDPVADKLLVATVLILLSARHGIVVALPTCVILNREIAVSALREWMAQRNERDVVQVGWQGKVKTALTMLSLTLFLLLPAGPTPLRFIHPTRFCGWPPSMRPVKQQSQLVLLQQAALISLYASAVITVTSGLVYFQAAAPLLMQSSSSSTSSTSSTS
jgi:CDP-diacylglycerol---glycerol-3-phosphate 3-phosphatidyltransferase